MIRSHIARFLLKETMPPKRLGVVRQKLLDVLLDIGIIVLAKMNTSPRIVTVSPHIQLDSKTFLVLLSSILCVFISAETEEGSEGTSTDGKYRCKLKVKEK